MLSSLVCINQRIKCKFSSYCFRSLASILCEFRGLEKLIKSLLTWLRFEVSMLFCDSDVRIFTVNFIAYNYVEIHL